jgi:hypothetical protein
MPNNVVQVLVFLSQILCSSYSRLAFNRRVEIEQAVERTPGPLSTWYSKCSGRHTLFSLKEKRSRDFRCAVAEMTILYR